tara:strand:+ start:302 stop:454 length:153 start_codon:yes stop_codon:yes gene_type:complete
MIEFMLAFFLTVATVEVTANAATTVYNYAEPTVTQGVGYIKNKISPAEQE